jgi:4-amino-4-deoxy-L-arabinose transferase-like glycosyltransferase
MVIILLLSAALFWHDLGTREVLGQDENLTITQLDQPNLVAVWNAALLKATGQPSNMQPLYFLPQHLFWPLVDRSAFMLRFLPSIFAILAVAFTYKLGEVLLSRVAGLIGALLTALLPLTVHYAQIARPYTLLTLLSLASAYCLFQALKTNRALYWLGFVLTATLNLYTHYNALFVLLAEGLYTAVVWLMMLIAVLQKKESPRRLLGPVLGWLAVVLLCLPGLIRLVQLPWVGTRGKVQVELTFTFFHRFLYKIGLTTAWLRGLTVGAMCLGLASTLYRRRWRPALFAILWLAVPFLVLSVMKSPRPFVERYLIFVPPAALLLAGEGIASAGQMMGELGRRRNMGSIRGAVTVALTVGLGLLFVVPLRAYYASNRAADRLDQTIEVLERHVRPGDLVIVSPRFFVRPLNLRDADVLYLTEHLTSSEFEHLLPNHRRTWVLYTSYLPSPKLQEPLDQWLQAHEDEWVRVPIKSITALAFHSTEPSEPEARLKEHIVILEDLAKVSADEQEAWLRHEALAQAHEALADQLDRRGEQDLAARHRKRAEEARAAAPRPW